MKPDQTRIRIGADVGGTFTDVVLIDDNGMIRRHKLPSTPPDFEEAVLEGIKRVLNGVPGVHGSAAGEVAHGTTVATNAVLERQGARTALITTRGFRDVLELRRMRAPALYDLFFDKPETLVERALCFEITERILSSGEVLVPLAEPELWDIKAALEKERVESVAVCLLHSYAFPRHEVIIGDFFRKHMPKMQVSLSCEVLREMREYERTATTVVNAYVSPVMRRYLGALRAGMRDMGIEAPLLIMQSTGGLTTDKDAAERPVYVLESGPAGGVLAARYICKTMGIESVITLDMGGTTAKAALIEDGKLSYCPEYEVGSSLSTLGNRMVGGGGELIRAPSIDIAEVGAGGGSIAYLDQANGVHVGPRSAGAYPGPACYQRGGQDPTVTDANVVLGFIRAGKLADGSVTVDAEAARRVIHDRIAGPLGIDVLEAAEGIHRIANARMMGALRAVSSERGRDPREYDLIAFGGSGPVHAAGLSRELRTRRVFIPPLPGLFSAVGLLCSCIEHHEVRSCFLSGDSLNAGVLNSLREEMRESILSRFAGEGYPASLVSLRTCFDMRFKGQTSDIRITIEDTPRITCETVETLKELFMREHERLYGHRSGGNNPVEVVAARLVGEVDIQPESAVLRPAERLGEREPGRKAYFGRKHGVIYTPVLTRQEVRGATAGPFFIDEYDTTIVVPPGTRVSLGEHESIVMETNHA